MGDGEFSTLPGTQETKPVVEQKITKPEASAAPPPKGNFTRNLLVALIVVVIIIAVVAAYTGYVNVPGITPKKGEEVKPVPGPTPPPAPPEEEEEMPPPLPDE